MACPTACLRRHQLLQLRPVVAKRGVLHCVDTRSSSADSPLGAGTLLTPGEFIVSQGHPPYLTRKDRAQSTDSRHGFVGPSRCHVRADCDAGWLTENDQQSFASKRLKGGIVVTVPGATKKRTTTTVRARSVEVETQLLHSMLKWAVTVRVRKGQRLLDRNPLEGVKRPHELNPRRPMASVERFNATRNAIAELADTPMPTNPKRHEDSRRNWYAGGVSQTRSGRNASFPSLLPCWLM